MRCSVHIQYKENKYTGNLRCGEEKIVSQLPNLELGPEVEVPLNGETRRLGELVEEFMRYDPIELKNSFDERGQLEIGQYLFSQLFEKINSTDAKHFLLEKDVDLRIVTSDEHISRLPWPLLANKGIFLSTVGWSVSISSRVDIEDCELSPSPCMMVLAPQPAKLERTQAESHLEELGNKLSESDHRLAWGRNLRLARTLDEFAKLLKHDNFKPEIVYYYGHGADESQKAQLRFAVGEKRDLRDVPMANFALFFRKMKVPLRLVYINCCYGDAAGLLGAGRQFGDFVPAVIANRTVVEIPVTQAQAIALWESILLKGTPPHKAVSELYVNMGDIDLSVSDVRWIAPVVHCHYDKWKANPPTPPSRMVHDPFWHLKIDRVAQFGTVATQTRQMLRECKPRSLAFVWYGKKGQGIETFHRRLNVELREDNPSAFVIEIRPEWPAEFHNPHRSFSDMMAEAFEVNHIEDIPARIRSKSQGAFGKQTLVNVRHQSVKSSKFFNPRILKTYLEWWDHVFVPLIKESRTFLLLGVSFIVENPPKFRRAMLEQERLEDLELHETVFRLLDEMEKIARKDLLDFLRTHNIRLPIKRRDQALERILEKTGGHYQQTIEQLKNLVDQVWDLTDETVADDETPSDEFDY